MDMEKSAFEKVVETVAKLRNPNGGCPWDLKQDFKSLRPYLIEESYEVLDVLDQIKDQIESPNRDPSPKTSVGIEAAPAESNLSAAVAERLPAALAEKLKEELGDLLLQILLHSQIASETGTFQIQDVARALDEKLIRRHPHVFGATENTTASSGEMTADAVLIQWEKRKLLEKEAKAKLNQETREGTLSGLPKNLPALMKAYRTIERVTKIGFQWPDTTGPRAKLHEELNELEAELDICPDPKNLTEASKQRIEKELGDVLFSAVNLAFMYKIDPEQALRSMLLRFESRFNHVEKCVYEKGGKLEDTPLSEMDAYWDEAKKLENLKTSK